MANLLPPPVCTLEIRCQVTSQVPTEVLPFLSSKNLPQDGETRHKIRGESSMKVLPFPNRRTLPKRIVKSREKNRREGKKWLLELPGVNTTMIEEKNSGVVSPLGGSKEAFSQPLDRCSRVRAGKGVGRKEILHRWV